MGTFKNNVDKYLAEYELYKLTPEAKRLHIKEQMNKLTALVKMFNPTNKEYLRMVYKKLLDKYKAIEKEI